MPRGTVAEFDTGRGLGTVRGDDGRSYVFHLVEIADGTRTIDVDQRVTFRVLARFGTRQAGSLHAV